MSCLTILCAGALLDDGATAGADDSAATFAVHGRAALSQALEVDGLGRRLSRARCLSDRRDDALVARELPGNAWLREQFSLPQEATVEASSAWIDMPADTVERDRPWRVTPVSLHVGLDHLVLVDPGSLDLTDDDARELAHAAAPVLDECGIRLTVGAAQRWYLHGRGLSLLARESMLAAGRSTEAYEPAGDDARQWRRIVNLLQMTWHEHPVNERRASAGLAPVNSLWLEGRAARPERQPFALAYAGSAAVRGLLQAAGGRAEPWPPATDGTPEPPPAPRSATAPLIVIDDWFTARLHGDLPAWQQAWRALAALLTRVATGERQDLAAAAGGGRILLVLCGERRRLELLIEPGDRWRFWRAADPVALLAGSAR